MNITHTIQKVLHAAENPQIYRTEQLIIQTQTKIKIA